jgi:hypothetical protein
MAGPEPIGANGWSQALAMFGPAFLVVFCHPA